RDVFVRLGPSQSAKTRLDLVAYECVCFKFAGPFGGASDSTIAWRGSIRSSRRCVASVPGCRTSDAGAMSITPWPRWPGAVPAFGRSRADCPRRHRIPPLRQGALPALFDHFEGRSDRVFPCHGIGGPRRTRPLPRAAARTGIRRAARRNREAGLRKSRLSALARRPWCNLRAPRTCLSRRRFVFLPADLRGSTPSQRELPIRLQTGLPPDADGISFRRRTVRARRDAQAWESALSLSLQMAVRPAPARRQGRHARQLAL